MALFIIFSFVFLLPAASFCCTPKKFIILKHMSRVYARFSNFFCYVAKRSETVQCVCVSVCLSVCACLHLEMHACITFLCSFLDAWEGIISFPVVVMAFEGRTPFLWNLRFDLAVCLNFLVLWKRWWAILQSPWVWGPLAYLYIRMVWFGGNLSVHVFVLSTLLYVSNLCEAAVRW